MFQHKPKALRLATFLHEVSGQTFVESVVALSLFVSVLIPMGAGMAYFIGRHTSQNEVMALAMGQEYMEETLSRQEYHAGEAPLQGSPWHMIREVQISDGLVLITIRVRRGSDPRPMVELTTMRRIP